MSSQTKDLEPGSSFTEPHTGCQISGFWPFNKPVRSRLNIKPLVWQAGLLKKHSQTTLDQATGETKTVEMDLSGDAPQYAWKANVAYGGGIETILLLPDGFTLCCADDGTSRYRTLEDAMSVAQARSDEGVAAIYFQDKADAFKQIAFNEAIAYLVATTESMISSIVVPTGTLTSE